jgi:manganese transport protein
VCGAFLREPRPGCAAQNALDILAAMADTSLGAGSVGGDLPSAPDVPCADEEARSSPAAAAAAISGLEPARQPRRTSFQRDRIWSYFGPAFVASVAYIDPGNFSTNILAGSQFGYRLLWVLLWSNAMAILIQYLSAKLGIVTGKTLPQNIREHFGRRATWFLWICGEVSAVATDLAEFLGAALGLDLLLGPALQAHGWSPVSTLFLAAVIATVAVFGVLALDLAGYQWLERGIMFFVGAIGLCYGFEVFLVHPDWQRTFFSTLVPTFDRGSRGELRGSVFAAVGMLGATVMPHVIYLHSALVQPRLTQLTSSPSAPKPRLLRRYLHFELVDVFVAMNGAWLINSAMVLMAAVALYRGPEFQPDLKDAFHTLGPLLGRAAAVIFAVALLCSGLSSSTVGVMAGQVIIEGFLSIRFPIFLRRFLTVIPALVVIGVGTDPFKILNWSQVLLSFTLPFALVPLLLLVQREAVMRDFKSAVRTRVAGWAAAVIIIVLDAVLLLQMAFA